MYVFGPTQTKARSSTNFLPEEKDLIFSIDLKSVNGSWFRDFSPSSEFIRTLQSSV